MTIQYAVFLIPRGRTGILQDMPVEKLAKLNVWPDRPTIVRDDGDIRISVNGLLAAVL